MQADPTTTLIEAFASSVDEGLAVDVTTLSDEDLTRAVTERQRLNQQRAALDARLQHEWNQRRLWASDGSRSGAARLARDCRIAKATAARQLGDAKVLARMPLLAEALAAGATTLDHVRTCKPLTRPSLRTLLARDEAVLVGHATNPLLTHAHFRILIDAWDNGADPDGNGDRAARNHQDRTISHAQDAYGRTQISGMLEGVGAAIFRQELWRLEQELFLADWALARAEHGDDATVGDLARTNRQRRADALVLMAERSASLPDGTSSARPLVTVLVDLPTLRKSVCEFEDGARCTPEELVGLLTRAEIERAVFNTEGLVINLGRRSRFFTGPARRAIEIRDRYCSFPECTVPAEACDVDHFPEWSQGGATNHATGRLLCPAHNRARPGRHNHTDWQPHNPWQHPDLTNPPPPDPFECCAEPEDEVRDSRTLRRRQSPEDPSDEDDPDDP